MNYNKLMKKIWLLVVVFLISSFSFAQDENFDYLIEEDKDKATGLISLSPEEMRQIKAESKRVKEVRRSSLALKRIRDQHGVKSEADISQLASLSDPLVVDNSELKYFPPIGNQGSFGSCAQFAGVYYMMTYLWAMGNDYDAKNGGDRYRLSPKWTYNLLNDGTGVSGSHYTSGYNIGNIHGIATWEEFPYNSNAKDWCMDVQVWRNALSRRFGSNGYLQLQTDLDLMLAKQMLLNGHIFNYSTYINSHVTTKPKNDITITEDNLYTNDYAVSWCKGNSGSHAMTIVGYNDYIWVDINSNNKIDSGEKGAFKIANSWGDTWRNKGYIWLAYDSIWNTTKVINGPWSNRIATIRSQELYFTNLRENYSPLLMCEYTVNVRSRNSMSVSQAISPANKFSPTKFLDSYVIRKYTGPYAFDGGTIAKDGTFTYDFSDSINNNNYYLQLSENINATVGDTNNTDVLILKQFKMYDFSSGGYKVVNKLTIDDVNTNNVIVGVWQPMKTPTGYIGTNYLSDNGTNKGSCSITYYPKIEETALHNVYIRYVTLTNAATNVNVIINNGVQSYGKIISQRRSGGTWYSLGQYPFTTNSTPFIRVYNTPYDNGVVNADSIMLEPVGVFGGIVDTYTNVPLTIKDKTVTILFE